MSNASVVEEYLASLSDPEKSTIGHLYGLVRQMVPDVTEELSYGMAAFKYEGKGLVAIVANKNFISLYPFCSVARLGVDVSEFEQTTGSIHFSLEMPIPDDLFVAIIRARVQQIDG